MRVPIIGLPPWAEAIISTEVADNTLQSLRGCTESIKFSLQIQEQVAQLLEPEYGPIEQATLGVASGKPELVVRMFFRNQPYIQFRWSEESPGNWGNKIEQDTATGKAARQARRTRRTRRTRRALDEMNKVGDALAEKYTKQMKSENGFSFGSNNFLSIDPAEPKGFFDVKSDGETVSGKVTVTTSPYVGKDEMYWMSPDGLFAVGSPQPQVMYKSPDPPFPSSPAVGDIYQEPNSLRTWIFTGGGGWVKWGTGWIDNSRPITAKRKADAAPAEKPQARAPGGRLIVFDDD